uniref:G_PROTEIN_RECEP_F1_2 domain-containing protein n=1 Tax=Elaeophora elaphi TaxID=1147741 RepID=A0A0R3RKQ4_9BILA
MLIVVITRQENPETLCGPFQYSEVLIAAACYTLVSTLLALILISTIFFCEPPIDFISSLEKNTRGRNSTRRSRKSSATENYTCTSKFYALQILLLAKADFIKSQKKTMLKSSIKTRKRIH